jgi:fumarate reductase flavoprotein subunit
MVLPLRTPPYYGFKCIVGILHTNGGIKIDGHMRVVNKEGNPIPRLYTAGDETGGWAQIAPSFILSSLGIAIPAARIAAENAVRYCLGEG